MAIGLQRGAKQGIATGFDSFHTYHRIVINLANISVDFSAECFQRLKSGVFWGLIWLEQDGQKPISEIGYLTSCLYMYLSRISLYLFRLQMVMSLGVAVSHDFPTVECHIIDPRFTDRPLYHLVAHVVLLGKLREMISVPDSMN